MKKFKIVSLFLAIVLLFSGCAVKQGGTSAVNGENVETTAQTENRIVSTSVSICDILNMLQIDGVVGVPQTLAFDMPERYKGVTEVGLPMGPNMEVVKSLNPTVILSPLNLEWDLKKGYDSAGVNYKFLDLNSLDGLHKSVTEAGQMFGKVDEAKKIVDDYNAFMTEYNNTIAKKFEGKEKPRVLIVMQVPGVTAVATDKSYVASLVKLAGGVNICAEGGDVNGFQELFPEKLLELDPDIIIRTCHADPEGSWKWLDEEFSKDIWTHFRAVKEGNVYDLSHKSGGMSANFRYKDGLKEIDGYFDKFLAK